MGRPVKASVRGDGLPRGMRSGMAAWYLGMSEAAFLRLVTDKKMPAGIPIKGMMIWDRFDLDSAFENWKARNEGEGNTINQILGINDD